MVRYSERLDKIMKNNLKNELKDNYTIIPNVLIRDNSVSDRARFIFCLLASKPDDWIFYNRALARELNYSVDTLRKYINELIRKGWIEKYEYPFKANDYILKATNSKVSGKTRHGNNPTPEKSDTYKEIPTQRNTLNKEIRLEEHKNIFNSARKLYPDTKRGNETEFEDFKKKHKDWQGVLPLLEPAIKRQIEWRQSDEWRPEWKAFKTWLSNRSWEDEIPIKSISIISHVPT